MSATAGWYPDPGGQAGQYRFWDGRAWSAATSSTPTALPPSNPLGGPSPESPPVPSFHQRQYGQQSGQQAGQQYGQRTGQYGGPQPTQSYAGGTGQPTYPPQRPPGGRKRAPVGWILGGVGVLAVVVLVIVLIVRSLTGSAPVVGPAPDPTDPSSSAATCPGTSTPSATAPVTTGGRVVSGKLSYPELGSPWSAPISDSRVPFGRDVRSQTVILERVNGKASWAANVLIARLLAGDGFFGPEQGSKIVVSCILGKFYGNAQVDRHDTKNQATTIDGHKAWLVESHLTYDIPDVKAKGELLIVLVVDVGQGEGGLYYASVPDTAPTLVEPARKALADLQVS